MPLKGEYEPSTDPCAREQAELYEATNGERGGDWRTRPVIVLTSVGVKTGRRQNWNNFTEILHIRACQEGAADAR